MRITLVTRIFLPEPSAASQRLAALAGALAERGDSVTVLTSTPPRVRRAEPSPRGYRIRRWPVLRDRAGYVRGYLPYLSFDVPALFRVLFSRHVDVVVVEPPPTTGMAVRIACALRRTPYVYYAADVLSLAAASTGAPGVVLRVVRWLESRALRGAAHVVAVSDGVAHAVRELAPTARVSIVGHGVDPVSFRADVPPQEPEVDAAYVGTASEWHGAGVFATALKALDIRGVRPRVAFVGQGSDWEQLAAELADLPHVTFGPPVDAESAARRLRGARVALASLRPHIGYDFAVPTKMYSALAVGTPVVLSAPPSLRAVVENADLGWACDDSAAAVADAIEDAVASEPSPGRRAAIAEWAVANVSATAVAGRVIDAIDEAAAGGRRRTG